MMDKYHRYKLLVSVVLYTLYTLTLRGVDAGVTLEYNILEEESTNFIIGYIANDTRVVSLFPPEIFESISYTFLSRKSPYLKNLDLDGNTGVLRVKEPLDRDEICRDKQVCEISVDVATQPVQHMEIITVKLQVWDINDNAPQFEEDQVTVEVAEGIQGATYPLPRAWDPDFGHNSIQDYRLVPNYDEFTLQVLDNGDGSDDFHLTLVESLDRESVDQYNLELLVWDGGDPSRTGTLTININVLDSNDNQPIFTQSVYRISIRENRPKGSSLIRVEAVDFDHSINGDVFYHFTKSTKAAYGDIFDINEDTGEIYTIGDLDYETNSEYSLNVAASDRAQNPFTAYAKVIINITNQNDSPPTITINGLGDSGVEIPENSPERSFVAHLRVHDPDSEENSKLSCSMSSPLFYLEEMGDSEYKIITAMPFDREVEDEYHVNLVCQDYGHPPQIAEEVIEVMVTDVNDHIPQILHNHYSVNVSEGTGTNDALLRVLSHDGDIGVNADITYSIQELTGHGDVKESENLMIHPKTGSIYITKSFDREKQDYYLYLVTARDSGSPPLSSNATVVLRVLDINDEAPKFVMQHFKFGTYENQDVGTEIGIINATDADLPPNDMVSYALMLSTEDSNAFEINSATGKITTKKKLDREAVYEYHLVVKATNVGSPLNSTANVTVYVVDTNDNAPHITFPYPGNNSVMLNSSISKGTTVATIVAQDADQGQNAALVYAIVGGNEDQYFETNMYGEIFLLKKLDVPNGITVFNLDIKVSDRGKEPLYSTQQLKLIVNGTLAIVGDKKLLFNLSGTTNIIIVTLCSTVTIIVFVVILLFILFMMRRKKDHHHHRAVPERRNSSTCMEATKALLSMGTGPLPPGSDATLDFSKGELQAAEPPAPGQDSLDSGVDFSGDRSPHQVPPHTEVVIVAKDSHNNRAMKGSSPHHNTDPALMETHSTFLSPYHKGGMKSSQELYPRQQHHPPADVTDGPCNMREIQLRVHDMLYNSGHTSPHDDSSASDSGKGPSEEGDHVREHPEEMEMTDFRFPTHYGGVHHNSTVPSLPSRDDTWNNEASQPNPYRIPTTFSQPQKVGHHPPSSQTGARHHQPPAGKPILKFSQQDPIPECQDEPHCQNNKPFSSESSQDGPNRKKAVHFVRPYSSGRDLPSPPSELMAPPSEGEEDDHKITNCQTNDLNKPGYIYCPSPKATQRLISGSNENFNANNNNKTSNNIANLPEYAIPEQQEYYRQKYPGQSRYFDVWRNSLDSSRRDDDSQDGFSDGETTTSGSYCMDTGSISEDTVLTLENIHNKHVFV